MKFSIMILWLISEANYIYHTLAGPVLRFFYMKSRALFNTFSPSSYTTTSSTQKEKDIVAEMRDADGFVEMCAIWGYEAEEHIVQTGDGYLLGLHRVRKKGVGEKRGRERSRGGAQRKDRNEASGRKVVYLHHGMSNISNFW